MSGFVAESRWRHLGLGSALRSRGGKRYRVSRERASCTPWIRWISGEMEVTIKSLLRAPCAVKVARTVLTGEMGRRTDGQRASFLPTMPALPGPHLVCVHSHFTFASF